MVAVNAPARILSAFARGREHHQNAAAHLAFFVSVKYIVVEVVGVGFHGAFDLADLFVCRERSG